MSPAIDRSMLASANERLSKYFEEVVADLVDQYHAGLIGNTRA
jgi:hypothetical protein